MKGKCGMRPMPETTGMLRKCRQCQRLPDTLQLQSQFPITHLGIPHPADWCSKWLQAPPRLLRGCRGSRPLSARHEWGAPIPQAPLSRKAIVFVDFRAVP